MRAGLISLLALVVPLTAAAQRIEVAALLGGYQSTPRTWTPRDPAECTPHFEPCIANLSRGIGSLIGGRITLNVGRHLGVDGTIQSGRATTLLQTTNDLGNVDWSVRENVATTSFALQPKVRLRIDEVIELAVAAGPAISVVRVTSDSAFMLTHSRSRLGMAFSGGTQVRVAGGLTLELRGSYAVYLPEREFTDVRSIIPPPEQAGQSVSEWGWSVGLAYALHR